MSGRPRVQPGGGGPAWWQTLRPRRAILSAVAAILVGGAVTLWSLSGEATRQQLTGALVTPFAEGSRVLGFTVDEILVTGRSETPRPTLLQALGTGFGDPILALDLRAARDRLLALPWVSAAEIERVLPNTLIIRLSERQPIALWQRRGQFTLIDRDGRALADDRDGVVGDLIVVVGDDAPPHAGRLLDMLASQPDVKRLVRAAVRVGGRRWNLHLENGTSIRLPEANPQGALQRLADYQRSQGLLDKDLATIDMRFADKLILQPREPKPAEAKPAKGNSA
jgi:cell division protein FtsQ